MRILSLLLLLTACLSCTSVKETSSSFTSLDEFLSQSLPSNEPGGAVLIMKGNQILFSRGYGIADVTTKEPITTKTLFNLGSISKTFVSNAILILRDEQKLSLDDNLLKYFPEFKNKEIGSKLTIRHLLTHTSGLPDIRNVSKDTVFYLTAKDAENWAPVMQTDTLKFEPGSRFEYSNPAFNALALIVEKVSGMKWQLFIKERIMDAAGMKQSTITDGPHPESGVSHGYNFENANWREDDYGEEPTFAASGNGGVWSSVEELALYELALQQASFLSKETVAESRTVKAFPAWSEPTDPFIGWSWFINKNDSLQTIGHTGSQGGFLCNYVTIPEKKIFFVILCNTPRDVRGITDRIHGILEEKNWLD
jgi:CubicO group peptidase (beta-lactamase class C family)